MSNQSSNNLMLSVTELRKRYGKKVVVDDVNLELKKVRLLVF
jgi:ABC-type sugar transport system ATPase subunit